MELLSKTNVSLKHLKQKSHRQTEMSILRKAKANRKRNSRHSATARLIPLVLCTSILLLGARRKTPKAVDHTATEGNLTIRLNYLGADLRSGENDPISAVEKLDLYFSIIGTNRRKL